MIIDMESGEAKDCCSEGPSFNSLQSEGYLFFSILTPRRAPGLNRIAAQWLRSVCPWRQTGDTLICV